MIMSVLPLCFPHVERLDAAETFRQVNAATEFRQLRLAGRPGDADEIGLADAVARVGEPVGEFPVVGDDDQALARSVEAAHGKHPFFRGNQVDDAQPAAGIVVGGDDAGGLVDGKVQALGTAERLAIDADFVLERIDAGAQLGDHLAIDLDAPLADQLVAIAPAADASSRQHLLEPLGAGRPASIPLGRAVAFVARPYLAAMLAWHGGFRSRESDRAERMPSSYPWPAASHGGSLTTKALTGRGPVKGKPLTAVTA
jgi:hypothetical protein